MQVSRPRQRVREAGKAASPTMHQVAAAAGGVGASHHSEPALPHRAVLLMGRSAAAGH